MTGLRSMHRLAVAVALVLATTVVLHGYVLLNQPTWPQGSVVSFWVNPYANPNITANDAVTAVQTAANIWNAQTNANITLAVAGLTTDDMSYGGKNVVYFWPTDDLGVQAGTFNHWTFGNLFDADIVVAGVPLVTDGQSCTNAWYVESLLLHEFGHVLGLDHGIGVMAGVQPCNTTRLLDADNIAGVEWLYPAIIAPPPPPLPPPPVNNVPTVTAQCNPCSIKFEQTLSVMASAVDADGDALAYRWSAPSGTFATPTLAVTSWTSDTAGNIPLTVTVDDGKGGVASATVVVQTVKPGKGRNK